MQLLLDANPSWIVAETDLSSAFQRAAREVILLALFTRHEVLRDFIPLFKFLYGADAKLFFEDMAELLSTEGSHQGCPLGGLLFVLSIAGIIEKVQAAFPEVTIIGLADDYRFLGEGSAPLDAADMYRREVTRAGHVFQADKSWLFSRSQEALDAVRDHPLAAQMKVAPPSAGLRVLGAPLGSADWCTQWLADNTAEVQKHYDAVKELADHDDPGDPGAVQAAFVNE